ncbi:MAG: threonine/serine dehydratase [Deltaproteobacteria bacterium]|jgi:threonine dehydratase|nr:threonine/serine dehydratase [Deltaproteobacteria bacterium]MBW2531306.1 threonine/serine dehydratase [Deltaproteobacteria bacterium]
MGDESSRRQVPAEQPGGGELAVGLPAVRAAAALLAGRVRRTPVLRSDELDRRVGASLWLKAENRQHIGAFKARGALHTVSKLSDAERRRGLCTYSSGNHGQAVAWAARQFGVSVAVAMPEDAPAIKVDAVRALGAEVTFAGTTSADRKRAALLIAERTGAVVIPPFDHPDIVAGQGTATLELLEQARERSDGEPLDAVLVPVGGGGLCAGACLAAAESPARVFSVEPESCDAMAQSLERGERVSVQPGPTLADGLKPVRVGELNFQIARRYLAGSLRVSDEQIGRALVTLRQLLDETVEPSGAAALAAALSGQLPSDLRRVGVILSGGNIAPESVRNLEARFAPYEPLVGNRTA